MVASNVLGVQEVGRGRRQALASLVVLPNFTRRVWSHALQFSQTRCFNDLLVFLFEDGVILMINLLKVMFALVHTGHPKSVNAFQRSIDRFYTLFRSLRKLTQAS